MQLIKAQSTLISLIKFDVIPILELAASSELRRKLANHFDFEQIELREKNGSPVLVCSLGTLNSGTPILTLAIEERKIVCTVGGKSKETKAFYDVVIDFLMQIASCDDITAFEPVLVANESEMIVKLDIDVASLFPESLLNYMEGEASSKLSLGPASARIKPVSVMFEVDYFSNAQILDDYKITLTRKEISLQLRPGYPQENRVFISKMPVDSDTHMELLTEIEQALNN
ncbi:MAG: hypothetical protein H6665_14540 [Ardenticatenaceae bacterium]|nr:hypothetical protein [Ardenticatenaceae bacterium]